MPDQPNNPWGRPSGGDNRGQNRGPWGNNGGSGGGGRGSGGDIPPDLDEMLKKAQENLRQIFPTGFQGPRLFGLILLGIIALWFASGLYIIVPGENGVIQRFGKWSDTKVTEGLGYRLPYPIETLTKINVSEMRRMSIGFSDRMVLGAAAQRQNVPEGDLLRTRFAFQPLEEIEDVIDVHNRPLLPGFARFRVFHRDLGFPEVEQVGRTLRLETVTTVVFTC